MSGNRPAGAQDAQFSVTLAWARPNHWPTDSHEAEHLRPSWCSRYPRKRSPHKNHKTHNLSLGESFWNPNSHTLAMQNLNKTLANKGVDLPLLEQV